MLGAILGGIGALGSIYGASKQAKQAKEANKLAQAAEKRQRQLFEQAQPYYNPILQYFAQRAGLNMPDMRVQQSNQSIYDAVMKAKPKNREKTYQDLLKRQSQENEWRQRLGMGDGYEDEYGMGDGYDDDLDYYEALYGEGDSGFGIRKRALPSAPAWHPTSAPQSFESMGVTPEQQQKLMGVLGGSLGFQRMAPPSRNQSSLPPQLQERFNALLQRRGAGSLFGGFGQMRGQGDGYEYGMGDGYDDDLAYYEALYGEGDGFSGIYKPKRGFGAKPLKALPAATQPGASTQPVTNFTDQQKQALSNALGTSFTGANSSQGMSSMQPGASTQAVPSSTQPGQPSIPGLGGGTVSDQDLGIFNQRQQRLQFAAADEDLRRQMGQMMGNSMAGLGRRGLANSSLAAGMQERLGNAYQRDLGGFRRQLAIDAPREQDRLMMQMMSGMAPGFGAGESAAGMAQNQASMANQMAGNAWGGVGQSLSNLAYLDALNGKKKK